MRHARLTVSSGMADHGDIITMTFVESPLRVYAQRLLMLSDDNPLRLFHHQALCTKCAAGLSIGMKLVSVLRCESEREQLICAGKGRRIAAASQNTDRSLEELSTLGGDTVDVCDLVRG